MAADHGVTAQGVSPYPREVTAQMVLNFVAGGAAICQLARHASAELILVDVGVDAELPAHPRLIHAKVAPGTADLSVGPAMTPEQAAEALLTGVRMALGLAEDGATMLATGEMGIGNTTAASALTCALTGADPVDVVGPGTGLDAAGVAHKREVVARGLEVNAAAIAESPFEALAAVGGLEIAGLAGVVIGAATAGIPGRRRRVHLRCGRSCGGPHRTGRRGLRVLLAPLGGTSDIASCSTRSASSRCWTWTCGWAREPARRSRWRSSTRLAPA